MTIDLPSRPQRGCMDIVGPIIVVLICIFLAIGLISMFKDHQDCKNAGGTPVRGIFGIECIPAEDD